MTHFQKSLRARLLGAFSIGVLCCLSLLILFSCDAVPNAPGVPSTAHLVESYLLKNLDNNSATAAAWFRRNDSSATAGPVYLDSAVNNMALQGGVYVRTLPNSTAISGGAHHVSLNDNGAEIAHLAIVVPDSFSITNINPANRISTGGNVSLNWEVSLNATGYIIGAAKRGQTYQNKGYAAFSNGGGNSGSLPPDAFFSTGTSTLDTGWYYIYVYSYTGAPKIDSLGTKYPTVLPTGFARTINQTLISGFYGAAVISHRDSVHIGGLP